MKTKLKNIDEVCGQPAGSFEKFIKDKEQFQKDLEIHRKARIQAIKHGLPLPPSPTFRGRAVFLC